MKRLFMCFVPVLFVFGMGFCACSQAPEEEPEKGKIEKITDQVAADAVEGIKAPINKARAVKDMSDKRVQGLGSPSSEE